MLLIEFSGTAKSLKHHDANPTPYHMLVVLGRTKNNQLSGAKLLLPMAATTEGTNIQPGKWLRRLVDYIKSEGRRGGCLFQRRLIPTLLAEYENDFFPMLERVQNKTNLIDKELDIREVAGIYRTLRRGVSDHLINMEVDETLIKAINRWHRKRRAADGIGSKRNMLETYSTLSSLTPTLLRYSLKL